MKQSQSTARIVGLLFLFIFISGIVIFQVLQGPVLFTDDFLTTAAENRNQLIASVLLFVFSGFASVLIAVLLLPIFKKFNVHLAYLYLACTLLNFIAIMVDNVSVVSMLELSQAYSDSTEFDSIATLKTLVAESHYWTHYFYLLISCFPVFVLYSSFYVSRLIPRVLSLFGIFAVLLMFVEELFSFFGNSISMNMMLPLGLIQLLMPIWLIIKGFNYSKIKDKGVSEAMLVRETTGDLFT